MGLVTVAAAATLLAAAPAPKHDAAAGGTLDVGHGDAAPTASAEAASGIDDGLDPATRERMRLLRKLADGGMDDEEMRRLHRQGDKQTEAARFFEEHQRKLEEEEANRELIYAAILLAALVVGWGIRKARKD